MKNGVRLVLLALAAGLAFWLWNVLFPSPEKLVLRKISQLAATACISAKDSSLARAGKATSLVGDFANDAEIVITATEIGSRTLSGRDEIREAALGGFATLSALNVQFMDTVARVGADQQTAQVTCTARVNDGDSKDFGIQEMRFRLKKIDGTWLITRAETVKTLQ